MAKLPTKKQIQKKRIIYSAIAAAFVLMVIVFYMIMTHSGHWLVDDDEFEHVKWAVVLDGQSADMERIDLAADLVASGKVDSVLILGRRILRTRSNAEFYLEDFLRLGQFDSNAVFIARHDDPSTIGEAFTIVPWLKKHNADTVLLITGAAVTHRVKRIFQTSYFDLLPTGILTAADSFYYKPIVSAKEYENEKDPIVDLQSLLPKVKEKAEPVADTTAKDTTAVKNDSTASKKDSSK